MLAVAYGAGTNSVAMLVGMKARGIRPDYITFADTGGEKPNTYAHIEIMKAWCDANDFPEITIVRKGGRLFFGETLEQDCLRRSQLPSIAYGFKTCSAKYKIQPQDMYFNNLAEAKAIWRSGEKIVKYVGYDIGESHRANNYEDDKYDVRYPLIEWGWGRDDCIAAIQKELLPLPGKSSCFFCPSMRQTEVRELAVVYPDLAKRALAMESNAELTSVKGLGRSYAWRDLLATDDMFPENYIEEPCGCYDGH